MNTANNRSATGTASHHAKSNTELSCFVCVVIVVLVVVLTQFLPISEQVDRRLTVGSRR